MTQRLMIMLAAAAALAGLVAWDMSQRAAAPAQIAPAAPRPVGEVLAPALERPLFSPSRRPPQDTATAAEPEPVSQTFRLLGIAQSDGVSVAVIEIDGARARLKRGQSIAGWRLHSIGPRRVVLVRGETEKALSF